MDHATTTTVTIIVVVSQFVRLVAIHITVVAVIIRFGKFYYYPGKNSI